MSSVRESWGLACPKCHRDDKLFVAAESWAHFQPDGTETASDYEWSNRSRTSCEACFHSGVLDDFNIDKP